MSAHKLIERLDSPRQTARDSWIARCPAHADKRPSLAVRALDDGRTLIHCFAGCGTDAVLGAIGLTVSDLFPPKPTEYSKRQSPADLARLRARIEADQKARQKEADALHRECREHCARVWANAAAASPLHPYCVTKGISPVGARQHGDELVIPVGDAAGTLHGLQVIRPDGSKRFKTNTLKRSHFGPIEPVNGQAERLIICEGFATGCSLYSSFGGAVAVAVAFDAGNLGPVALALAAKYPQTRITIAGDVDASGVGQKAAREAAALIGADVMLPDFSPFTEAQLAACGFTANKPPSDFNDLAQLQREAR